ncbi:hypothetical protein [Rubritalea marina]|uniref:hypothetical protein n=1 Tax=Rubritalea marina TaxID=361055 RepID=UPI0012EA0E14|nr:hypothetical protein [Rubritalea marina]
MNRILRMIVVALGLLFTSGMASASLKPGEILLRGKLVEFDKKKKEIVFHTAKHGKDLVFKFEGRKGPLILFNEKKISIRRYQSKQDEMYHEAVLVYQPLNEYDKTNVDMVGYVVRMIGACDEEFHAYKTQTDKSER